MGRDCHCLPLLPHFSSLVVNGGTGAACPRRRVPHHQLCKISNHAVNFRSCIRHRTTFPRPIVGGIRTVAGNTRREPLLSRIQHGLWWCEKRDTDEGFPLSSRNRGKCTIIRTLA